MSSIPTQPSQPPHQSLYKEMAQAQASSKELTETVLVRHPLPKYSFQGKKLPKESPASLPPRPLQPQEASAVISAAVPVRGMTQNASDIGSAVGDRKAAAVRPFTASTKPDPAPVYNLKPNAAVVAPNVRSGGGRKDRNEPGRMSDSSVLVGSESVKATPSGGERGKGKEVSVTYLPSVPAVSPESVEIPIPDAALLAHAVEGPSLSEKLEKAEKEIAMLRSQLDVQLQVNAEIKRLLVASVGEDFERKVENLARDRAELAMELGDFTKKMTEDYENLDQISIQADMWRSKYLASRVMVEELASARAFYSGQFQDSQQAVQELLNERYELRAGLLHSYKILQQVKEAFDPLNSQKSHGLPSTNVLDLSKQIKQLSEAVRFRLLPAHAGSHVMMPLEESWESSMTKAELLAYDQLSKQSAPPSFRHSMPSSAPAAALTTSKSCERFHPMVRHDNLTVNCCTKCKGDIQVA
ncbi:golgin-45-like [Babylonia areolata]|uniref:golgin-45-like n=1 Tax=Babylonia areolata TaxID=304850 RepID=UPI003FCEEC6A